ncbi:reverse transcriptase domain-containing protein [Tanacetum coccineum]
MSSIISGDDPPSVYRSVTDQFAKSFDLWGIDFMGRSLFQEDNKYILVAVDYLSKWVEAKALPTNDARVVAILLKTLFFDFGIPPDYEAHDSVIFTRASLASALILEFQYPKTNRLKFYAFGNTL